jgi:hypothetical protein
LKSLHVCNLANVAYGYCKILKAENHDVKLICHDIDHLMSQPEWDDQDLDYNNFPDENNFFSSVIPVSLTRPAWYQRVDIRHYQDRKIKFLSRFAPRAVKELLRPYYYKIFHGKEFSVAAVPSSLPENKPIVEYRQDDIAKFVPNITWLRKLLAEEEVVFAYVISPIYAMFCHEKPFVAVEIGTMRDLPFENSSNGRLLKAAYREADHVLITNPDVKVQADEIGVKSYSFCPHPVDEDRYKPAKDSSYREHLLEDLPDTEWLGVAPARQNWDIKGNDKYIEAIKILREKHQRKVSLVVPAWGQDVEKSKRYAEKLGVDKYIKWIPPVSESTLIRMFSSLDFVLDQFQLGVFGLITPKALSCGGIVITSYNEEVHEWCFSEHPPLFAADSVDSIVARIVAVTDGKDTTHLREVSRKWFMKHHSKKVVKEQLEFAAAQAIRNFEAKNEKITFG